MLVTIWRHGEAGAAASDRERQLTSRGRLDVAHGAQCFQRHLAARDCALPDMVHHSAWVRTTQTAEILAGHLTQGLAAPLRALQPGSDIEQVDLQLGSIFAERDFTGHALLVSHQPMVSRLADYYLGRRGLVPPLPPGGQVTISMDYPAPDAATLLFWAFPSEYEAMC